MKACFHHQTVHSPGLARGVHFPKSMYRIHAAKVKKKKESKKDMMIEERQQRSAQDAYFMRRCIQLARCGLEGAAPNPMVGAVVVYNGQIIGEGYHRQCGGPHAEVNAIASVADKRLLSQSTLYVSLEPCAHYGKTPPCADLIISHHIPRVVIGHQDPFAKVNGLGIQKLRDAGTEVTVGILESECRQLNKRFITFHTLGRPWITLKWAQSADGFIARTDGSSVRFSTAFTQMLVHKLRAGHQAIMVGAHTALWDNPTLTVRYWHGNSPQRIVLASAKQSFPSDLHLLQPDAPTIVYKDLSLPQILSDLHARGIQSLLVEGGSALHNSFLQLGLWDEIRVETAPCFLHSGIKAPSLPMCRPYALRKYGENRVMLFRNPLNITAVR